MNLLEKKCNVTIDRNGLSENASEDWRNELAAGLWGLANDIVMSGSRHKTDKLSMYLDYLRFGKFYQTAWFEEMEWMPFEDFMVPVPLEYDKILRATYGDYSVCVRNTTLHDYPFYNKQLEQLRKRVAQVEAVRKREV